MWYLDSNFLIILAGTVFFILCRIIGGSFAAKLRRYLLPVLFFAFILNYSPVVAAAYSAVLIINYMLVLTLRRLAVSKETRAKRLFIFSIILNSILFILISVSPYLSGFWGNISLLGFSYAYLKIVDIFYYAHYFEEDIAPFDFVSFILFVPTFTAGPILNFSNFKEDLEAELPPLDLEMPTRRIVIGFFKKVVIVKTLYYAHDFLLAKNLNPVLSLAVLFLFYIIGYMDFSGYSDIAIGFGKLLGFNVAENFKNPFTSPSLTVFWRNWHISLGEWIKKHISIFIKPKTRLQSGLSSFIIMLFIGLWHKFTPLYFLWGLWHGIFLFIEAYFNKGIVNKKKTPRHIYILRCVLTNLIVTFGCIFFYSDIDTVVRILRGLFFL
ncbi:hypothetical protein LJB89_02475 [Tyzzerella sp. OttesenSCG-928-J15]|nr:hypothetical protein [Tyzzerella sp. OttesenSCG-928-J15]